MNGITFTSQDCRDCAARLKTSSSKLNTILTGDIARLMQSVKQNYQSEGASDIYRAYDSVAKKFNDFVTSVNNCATYLNDTVAPSYEAIEKKVQQNVQM